MARNAMLIRNTIRRFDARLGPDAPFCFALSGLILLVPANLLPLVGADELGNRRVSLLLTGVGALWDDHMHVLSVLVLLCGLVFPLALLLSLLLLHGPDGLRRGAARLPWLPQFARLVRMWAFPEVQMLGVIVGVIKLQSLVHLEIGPGFWCYGAMMIAALLARRGFDRTFADEPERPGAIARWLRVPKDRSQCIAFALASIVLLFPAQLLPVLHTETTGDNRTDTIFSGAMELGRQGMWGLAIIVFTASMLIPGLKLAGIGCLLYATRDGAPARGRRPAPGWMGRLHTVLRLIGRWSMLDVFLAAFLVGLVAFGEFATVEAQDGLIAFALVVVLTILATESFDRRLIT